MAQNFVNLYCEILMGNRVEFWPRTVLILIPTLLILFDIFFSAGFLADLSGSYTLTFYVAGSFHAVAGCIFFLSYCIKNANAAHEDLNDLLQLEKFLIVEIVTVL